MRLSVVVILLILSASQVSAQQRVYTLAPPDAIQPNELLPTPSCATMLRLVEEMRRLPEDQSDAIIDDLLTTPNQTPPPLLLEAAVRLAERDESEAALWYEIGFIRMARDVNVCRHRTGIDIHQRVLVLYDSVPVAERLEELDLRLPALRRALAMSDLFDSEVSPWWACSCSIDAARASMFGELLEVSDWLLSDQDITEREVEFRRLLQNAERQLAANWDEQ